MTSNSYTNSHTLDQSDTTSAVDDGEDWSSEEEEKQETEVARLLRQALQQFQNKGTKGFD
jgi:hypothetical protein